MIRIDFKKELEQASRGMIMIHDPNLLIKLIIRKLVRKLHIKHAGMIIYDPNKKSYVLSISRGETGVKIPSNFTRFNEYSPIIQLFINEQFKNLTLNRNAIVVEDINKIIWQEGVIHKENGNSVKDLLHRVNEQMEMLNAVICVPAYYQDKLMAILLLGQKYDNSKFDQEELDFFAALASDTAMAIRNAQLFEGLKAEAERNRKLFLTTIMVLGSTIEAKDAYTHGHTERVTNYALALARQMVLNGSIQLPEVFFENLYLAGLLHDIGKIGVPEAILNKKGKLTDVEYEIMKNHTIRGAEIVKPLNLAKETVDGIRHHHESFSGNGYPDGLKGAQIPISAAIIAVADTYDAMITDRPYRKGLAKEEAALEIERKASLQFNPIVVTA